MRLSLSEVRLCSALTVPIALQVVKSYQSGKKEGGDFVASWVSPRGAYLYCLGEDGNVFCFETIGKLESVLQVRSALPTM